jgi:ATP-dependent DNA ligase
MLKSAFEPCIPTRGTRVPNRPEWIHEIKHDGYRLIDQREAKRVPLFTRNGYDWSDRFPLISVTRRGFKATAAESTGERPS